MGSTYRYSSTISYGNAWTLYNPAPIRVTKISLWNNPYYPAPHNNGALYGCSILASNDDVNYILLKTVTNSVLGSGANWNIDLSDNANYYRYYQIKPTSAGVGGGCSLGLIKLTATEKEEIIK